MATYEDKINQIYFVKVWNCFKVIYNSENTSSVIKFAVEVTIGFKSLYLLN
jgi:hypothetical protein